MACARCQALPSSEEEGGSEEEEEEEAEEEEEEEQEEEGGGEAHDIPYSIHVFEFRKTSHCICPTSGLARQRRPAGRLGGGTQRGGGRR